MPTYLAEGRRVRPGQPDSSDTIAQARTYGIRPLCLCRPDGLPMYIARSGASLMLKRMPLTGCLHDPTCPSYEPPSAISHTTSPATVAVDASPDATTRVHLGFALSRGVHHGAPWAPPARGCGGSFHDPVVSLQGLLHHLWQEAGLTRWCPGFAGKRSWATVRGHLFLAARRATARGRPLSDLLYVPEPFRLERQGAIRTRREARWLEVTQGGRSFLLLIGELKVVKPMQRDLGAVVKQVPDLIFAMDNATFRRMEQRFAPDLLLWGASSDIRMIVAATCALDDPRRPELVALALMPATLEWLPVDGALDLLRLGTFVKEGRTFTKLPLGELRLDEQPGPDAHLEKSDFSGKPRSSQATAAR